MKWLEHEMIIRPWDSPVCEDVPDTFKGKATGRTPLKYQLAKRHSPLFKISISPDGLHSPILDNNRRANRGQRSRHQKNN